MLEARRDDAVNQRHIADSLARRYIEDLADPEQGRQWLDVLAGCLRLAGDETEIADYEALEAAWARLSQR